ncbi:hypothetical protein [Paractinoplanes lichenicola]|uniref:S1 motif domain-containing protein n=1 Tax=Paractinoplanes lichenicola TaxID=2802976 RepID=A0ABS1W022_9ACTN|nr:hypothetical protein [Actinoplanes lichenicola]MBL7259908.1 hypothetical protein [Actinoplanes lichenicola]
MLWRDVFVSSSVVGSDGLTAEVGGTVVMPLALSCRYRVPASAQEAPGSGHDLVGQVVEVRSSWPDGWMLDVGGLGIYVSEVGTESPRISPESREPGSDPPIPVPRSGAWVRVRGRLGIAEDYETGMFEPADELLNRAVRRWRVHRIVRLDAPGPPSAERGREVAAMRFDDLRRMTLGYLLDLEAT